MSGLLFYNRDDTVSLMIMSLSLPELLGLCWLSLINNNGLLLHVQTTKSHELLVKSPPHFTLAYYLGMYSTTYRAITIHPRAISQGLGDRKKLIRVEGR